MSILGRFRPLGGDSATMARGDASGLVPSAGGSGRRIPPYGNSVTTGGPPPRRNDDWGDGYSMNNPSQPSFDFNKKPVSNPSPSKDYKPKAPAREDSTNPQAPSWNKAKPGKWGSADSAKDRANTMKKKPESKGKAAPPRAHGARDKGGPPPKGSY